MASIFNAFSVTIFACSYDLRKNLAYNEYLSQSRADVFILGKRSSMHSICSIYLGLLNYIIYVTWFISYVIWKTGHQLYSEYQYDWGFHLAISASVLYFLIALICLWVIFNLDEIYVRQKDDFKKEDPNDEGKDYELNRDIPAYLVPNLPRDREAR